VLSHFAGKEGPAGIGIYRLPDLAVEQTHRFPSSKRCDLVVSPDGQTIAVSFDRDGERFVELWSLEGLKSLRSFAKTKLESEVFIGSRLAFTPEGRLLAVADRPAFRTPWRIRLFNVATAEEHAELVGLEPGEPVTAIAVTADGQRLLAAGNGGVELWDLDRLPPLASVGGKPPSGRPPSGKGSKASSPPLKKDGSVGRDSAPGNAQDKPLDQRVRTWSSRDGKFKLRASLVRRDENTVTLKRADNGAEITVEIEKLGAADHNFLERH
jgi:WD40 repeat protein